MRNRRFRGMALLILVAGTATATLATAPPALAEHGSSGDPISSVPPLFDGGRNYGTVSDHNDATKPNGKDGDACWGDTPGAEVYQFSVAAQTQVFMDVFDDLAGKSLCRVSLYRKHFNGYTLPALFGFPEREDYLVQNTDCPESYSVCRVDWRTPYTDTYYLVFWPGDDWNNDTNYAAFRFSIKVRRWTTTSLMMSGYYAYSDGYYKEHLGGYIYGKAAVSPASSGTVKFTLQKKGQDGVWRTVSTSYKTLSDSKATLALKPGSVGKYRLRASFLGNSTKQPSTSSWRYILITS